MWNSYLYLLLGCLLLSQAAAVWQCASDSECSSLSGSVCAAGECVCPATQQIVGGGTMCADFAPYHTSSCVDDFQCSRLFTAFHCRRNDDQTGNCFCQPGHHYFLGRCWPSIPLEEACTRNEECMGTIRDPYAMICDQTCQCAEGYYGRQRGECRRIGAAVGDRCVLDEDCQFANGLCDPLSFTCFVSTNPTAHIEPLAVNATHKMAATMTRQDGAVCSAANPCSASFQCSSVGICVCPLGYYGSPDGTACYAELGSPSTEAQCVGFLAEVQNGVCTCPANFFFDEGMRDCIKVARSITDFCFTDEQCHSFGAASFCGAPGDWGLRTCECDLEEAVWDSQRNMCRLFAGIGEACQVNSDCMAGELEIQCELDEAGEGFCACPDDLVAVDGLCLTFGLEVGEECQMTQECTGTANTECLNGRCTCGNGYQQVDDFCAPSLGGTCIADADCIINNTVCVGGVSGLTCQCQGSFVEYDDECWENSYGYNETCTVDAQCIDALGPSGACQSGVCLCGDNFHYRDGACWPVTGLFETCYRSSQCFLGDLTDTVVCRNSICQCDFDYPYSEELGTCISSAASITSSMFLVIATLVCMLSNA